MKNRIVLSLSPDPYISSTWDKPGHATENYGNAKLLKYKELQDGK